MRHRCNICGLLHEPDSNEVGILPEPPIGTWVKDRHGGVALHHRDNQGNIGWAPPGFLAFGKWEAMWEARGPVDNLWALGLRARGDGMSKPKWWIPITGSIEVEAETYEQALSFAHANLKGSVGILRLGNNYGEVRSSGCGGLMFTIGFQLILATIEAARVGGNVVWMSPPAFNHTGWGIFVPRPFWADDFAENVEGY